MSLDAEWIEKDLTLIELAGWVAPIATMIAAMMTAANLGARVTGWGFVVFTVGSICWAAVGLSSGQNNLLATNAFLTVVNVIGIWRWLARQRRYEEGGTAAKKASRTSSSPDLFTATGIAGTPVKSQDGAQVGKAVEALLECATGAVNYVVVSSANAAGLDEQLRPVPRDSVTFRTDSIVLSLDQRTFEGIRPLEGCDWPTAIFCTELPA